MLLYFVIKVLRFDSHYIITATWGSLFRGDPLRRRAEPHGEEPRIHPVTSSSSLPGPGARKNLVVHLVFLKS